MKCYGLGLIAKGDVVDSPGSGDWVVAVEDGEFELLDIAFPSGAFRQVQSIGGVVDVLGLELEHQGGVIVPLWVFVGYEFDFGQFGVCFVVEFKHEEPCRIRLDVEVFG